MELLEYWKEERLKFYENIGISRANLHLLNVPDEERAFYSKGTYDIEYDFPFGRQELEGVAYRTDYDLSQHQKASGKSLEYFDEETKERFIPHVVEPSAGVDRAVLAMICEAYAEDQAPNDKGEMEGRTLCGFIRAWPQLNARSFHCSGTRSRWWLRQSRFSIFSGLTCLFSTTRAVRSGVVIAGRMKSEHRFALLSTLKHSAKNKLIFEILSLCAKETP
jgi:Glycyl-tRNA synthetase (class II)